MTTEQQATLDNLVEFHKSEDFTVSEHPTGTIVARIIDGENDFLTFPYIIFKDGHFLARTEHSQQELLDEWIADNIEKD